MLSLAALYAFCRKSLSQQAAAKQASKSAQQRAGHSKNFVDGGSGRVAGWLMAFWGQKKLGGASGCVLWLFFAREREERKKQQAKQKKTSFALCLYSRVGALACLLGRLLLAPIFAFAFAIVLSLPSRHHIL